jgi:Tfp pilus assembly protein PilX
MMPALSIAASRARARVGVRARMRGVSLPVMLIILVVMMVTSIYMLRSTHSTALTTGNLAYDATMSRAADYGLHAGFQWLSTTAAGNKPLLDNDDATHGYEAKLETGLSTRDRAFWANSIQVPDADGNQIEYVIHRLCQQSGRYDQSTGCMMTSANNSSLGNTVALGDSMAEDTAQFADPPQVHYVITARIHGARGGNVINQMIVLIGA